MTTPVRTQHRTECQRCRHQYVYNIGDAAPCPRCAQHGWENLPSGWTRILKIFLHGNFNARRALAQSLGMFWLPCTLCGTFTAGYEWHPDASVTTKELAGGSSEGIGVCLFCLKRAKDIREGREPNPLLNATTPPGD